MKIKANEARAKLAEIEAILRLKQNFLDVGDDDWSTPEGYDDSPDQGVHRFDGGGTFF